MTSARQHSLCARHNGATADDTSRADATRTTSGTDTDAVRRSLATREGVTRVDLSPMAASRTAASTCTSATTHVASKTSGVGVFLHPGDSDSRSDVNDAINAYTPSPRRVAEEDWARTAAFVREAVRDALPRTRYSARNLLATVSLYVDWCNRVCGEDLDREVIFQPSLIAEWADLGIEGVTKSTAGNYRSRLLRVMEVLNPGAARPRMVALPPSAGVAPYSDDELHQIWVWAYGMANARNSRDAVILVGGCVGAGLTAREVADLRVRDVEIGDKGVVLHVSGARPRLTTLLRSVEEIFVDAATGLDPDAFVFRTGRTRTTKNTTSLFIHKYVPNGLTVSTQRLRATWIVNRASADLPIKGLMEAMGVQDFSAIARFLKHVPDLDPADLRARLRAESKPIK
ncbi:hypothetical protein [Demequina rhizosphaerae]|uniref:hypothetical protein n=1 Tax=Demequina rhizosphaerae TaxID=1638985 RepID=UPI000782F9DB|nr:hypothetical protein [Demequina rhizosphaerae]